MMWSHPINVESLRSFCMLGEKRVVPWREEGYPGAAFHGTSPDLVQIRRTGTVYTVYTAEIWLQVFKKFSRRRTVKNPRKFSDHKAGHHPPLQR